MKFCPSYVGLSCVDGSCPLALQEEYVDIYEDAGYPVIKNCKECHRYFGCDDCVFLNDEEYCPKLIKKEGECDGCN